MGVELAPLPRNSDLSLEFTGQAPSAAAAAAAFLRALVKSGLFSVQVPSSAAAAGQQGALRERTDVLILDALLWRLLTWLHRRVWRVRCERVE